jgi:ubiquinone/menaquinone biosynthesis C-methylase UbiE
MLRWEILLGFSGGAENDHKQSGGQVAMRYSQTTTEQISAYYEHYYTDELCLPEVPERIRARLGLEYESANVALLYKSLPDLQPTKILDLGCGTGGTAILISEGMGVPVHGVDTYGPAVDIAKLRVLEHHRARCIFTSGSGEYLPYETNEFDLVTSYQVLEHVSDPLAVLREIYRVMKPTAVAHITAPSYSSIFEPHYKINWLPFSGPLLARMWLRVVGRPTDFVKHINFITYRGLIKAATDAGFQVEHVTAVKTQLRVREKLESGPFRWVTKLRILERLLIFIYLTFKVCDHEFVLRRIN